MKPRKRQTGQPARAPAKSGAKTQRVESRPPSVVSAWLESHRVCAGDAARRLVAAPFSTLMTVCVVGIALLLPALLQLVNDNLAAVDQGFLDDSQLTVYLKDTVTEAQGMEVSDNLLSLDSTESVIYLSKEEVLQEFVSYSGYGDLLEQLGENPLPATILVIPADKSADGVHRLHAFLQTLPEAELVQMDLEWLQRLEAFRGLLSRINLLFAAILAAAVLFIIGNTIRLAIENRRMEIEVVKLVGGTNSFAARPFLYTGLFLGLAGGLFAGLLVFLVLAGLRGPLLSVLSLYGSGFQLQGSGFSGMLLLPVLGAALGWVGAVLSAFQLLKSIGDG